MKIRHIYITKEGEPMANPEMEYPIHGKSCEYSDCKCEIGDPCEAEKKYHSGLLPFEDKDDLPENIFHRRAGSFHEEPILIPDTLIPVDLEVEVVEQIHLPGVTPEWMDFDNQDYIEATRSRRKYRTVLRIKP